MCTCNYVYMDCKILDPVKLLVTIQVKIIYQVFTTVVRVWGVVQFCAKLPRVQDEVVKVYLKVSLLYFHQGILRTKPLSPSWPSLAPLSTCFSLRHLLVQLDRCWPHLWPFLAALTTCCSIAQLGRCWPHLALASPIDPLVAPCNTALKP
jgi:hypothetical protein